MARPCTVCEHPDRAAVEIGLANGIAARVLALRYGLAPDAVGRHKTNHMPPEVMNRLRVRGARSDAELARLREVESRSVLDNLVWQRSRLYANADRAAAIGDDAGERAALGEAGKVTERIAKLLGELGQHITVKHDFSLVASPEWHRIRTALVREARIAGPLTIAAVGRALEEAEAAISPPKEVNDALALLPAIIEHEARP